jgi:hypothetical protein
MVVAWIPQHLICLILHGYNMAATIWINPVVRGSCDTTHCGAGCCRIKVYSDSINYTYRWCEHFQEATRTCGIYDTRPEGCRTYPRVRHVEYHYVSGCSYYLAEA